MKNRIRRLLLALLTVHTFAAPAAVASSPLKDGDGVGKPAPGFEIPDTSGAKVSSASILHQGKAIVVNFWGLRCSACIEELPHLGTLQSKYREKVEVLGVNVDGLDAEALKAQIAKKKLDMRFTVVPDPDFKMVDSFRMLAAPLTVVIDAGGVVRYRHENYVPGDEVALEEAVRQAVSGGK